MTRRALLAAALIVVGVASAHAASCNLPSSTSATSASYSGRLFDADGSVTKVGKCVLTSLTRYGDTAATFEARAGFSFAEIVERDHEFGRRLFGY